MMQPDSVIFEDNALEVRKLSEINHVRTLTKFSLIASAIVLTFLLARLGEDYHASALFIAAFLVATWAQHAIGEEAMHHRAQPERGFHVIADKLVGHATAEPAVAAVAVKAEQMVAIACCLADPQFSDDTAVGERFLHSKGS